ncbi:MAG: NAD(P)-dependent oxidoreductase [Deltaproteobacteria bacterium]|nr:NAD(P)-dependent oxidoreductase [Deltaproteobacteria bacterium]
MRILVTGASGFIGSHLVRRLVVQGHDVVGLDRRRDDHAPPKLTQIVGDVTSPDDCRKAVEDCDALFHLAAKVGDQGPSAEYLRINAGGTANLAEQAQRAGLSRFVLMSSVAVHHYGSGHRNADETYHADGSMNAYAASKLAAEQIVRNLASSVSWVIVRPAVFPFGPGDFTGFVPLARALERGMVPLIDGGRAVLSTAYVENLVEGLVATLEPEAAGETFVLGDDWPITWKELLTKIALALGARPPFLSFPFGPLRLVGRAADWMADRFEHRLSFPVTEYRVLLAGRDCHFVSTKARRLLRYRPLIALDEAIDRTVAWYRSL